MYFYNKDERKCNDLVKYKFKYEDSAKTSYFGEMGEIEMIVKGVCLEPLSKHAPILSQFLELVYRLPIIINFDWRVWTEGWKILDNDNFDFNILDIPTKCKLITVVVRNDRFCEGALLSAFDSGLMLKILKSIEKQINFYNVIK